MGCSKHDANGNPTGKTTMGFTGELPSNMSGVEMAMALEYIEEVLYGEN